MGGGWTRVRILVLRWGAGAQITRQIRRSCGGPSNQGTTKPRSAVSVRNVGKPALLPVVTSRCWKLVGSVQSLRNEQGPGHDPKTWSGDAHSDLVFARARST